MARSRPRRSSGGSLPFILGTAAILLLFGVVGFAGYVYFFVPPEEEMDGSSAGVEEGRSTIPTATVDQGRAGAPGSGPGLPGAGASTGVAASGTARPGGTVVATAPTPAGTPARGLLTFRSTQLPYTVTYPENWVVRPAGVKIGEMTADAFLGPTANGFTPSITVYGQKVDPGMESDSFALANLQSLGTRGIQAQAQPEAMPPGAKSIIVRYPASSEDLKYNVTQVLFVQEGIGWVFTLSTAAAEGAPELTALRQMLSSFKGDKPRT